jgi:hypothetical protein
MMSMRARKELLPTPFCQEPIPVPEIQRDGAMSYIRLCRIFGYVVYSWGFVLS